ncbi:MAG: hypothetical protein ACR2NM_08790, partial [Bythopirellula sp.]
NSKSSDYLRTSSGPATKKVASKDKPEEITESSHVASIVGSFCHKGKRIELRIAETTQSRQLAE